MENETGDQNDDQFRGAPQDHYAHTDLVKSEADATNDDDHVARDISCQNPAHEPRQPELFSKSFHYPKQTEQFGVQTT